MFYVTETMTKNAIQKMQDFHESVRALYSTFKIDFSGLTACAVSNCCEKKSSHA